MPARPSSPRAAQPGHAATEAQPVRAAGHDQVPDAAHHPRVRATVQVVAQAHEAAVGNGCAQMIELTAAAVQIADNDGRRGSWRRHPEFHARTGGLGPRTFSLKRMALYDLMELEPLMAENPTPGLTAPQVPGRHLTFLQLERLAWQRMRGRLIISRFAVLTGLSSTTLRYYDEIDLLRPAAVDGQTGYRYYGVAQIELAVRIRRWRELGLPLDDIRIMIQRPAEAPEVLARHAKRLSDEIEDRQHSLRTVRAYLKEEAMNYRIEHLPARQTLSIRARLQPPHYEVIPEALKDVTTYAKARGYQLERPSFFVHDTHDTGEGSLVEVHLPVVGTVEGHGRIEVRTFEGGLAFIGRFVGSYDKTGAAYAVVVEEAMRRDLRINGVTAEFYVKSVPDTPNPEAYETDIAFFLDTESPQ